MLRADAVRYLEQAGFHYKPAESPDLWSYLESHFASPQSVGLKFNHLPGSFVAELIAMGEEALLDAMVALHQRTGALGRVERVIELPYVVGTGAAIRLTAAEAQRALRLVIEPGTPQERIVHVMPVEADAIPCTTRMTATGGLYPDGHTAGYYDLRPGEIADKSGEGVFAWFATPDEIACLAREMEAKIEDITVVSRAEAEEMVNKVEEILGRSSIFD
jgi:hypothetical protein